MFCRITRCAFLFAITTVALSGFVVAQPTITDSSSQARLLLVEAKRSALLVRNDFQRQLLIEEIGTAQAKAGDLDGAIDSANRSHPFSSNTLEAVGDALVDSNDYSRAKALTRKLKGAGTFTFFSYMATSLARKGRINEALKTAELITFSETRSYALEEIAQHQMIAGDFDGARKTFELARRAHAKGLMDEDEFEAFRLSQQLARGEEQQVRAQIASWEPEKKFAWLIGGAEHLRQQGKKSAALTWLGDVLRELGSEAKYEFFRYHAIPIQVKLGEKDAAFEAADKLTKEMRVKGHMAIAISCAEDKDLPCVERAIEKMRAGESSLATSAGVSQFALKLMILNVTSALIAHGGFPAALRWLAYVEKDDDDITSIGPRSQLQRVIILAHEGKFSEARGIASQMRPNSITDLERGNALRITTLLETKANGSESVQRVANSLRHPEDRAYALLGIAQALLSIGETKLSYSAIQIH